MIPPPLGERERNDPTMKILYLSACSQLGGAERALLDLLASIRATASDHSLHVVTTEDGPLVSECHALGVEATVVRLSGRVARLGDAAIQQERVSNLLNLLAAAPPIVTYLRRLRRVIRSFAPDVVHTNGFKMHVLGALAKPRRTPLIWHLHDYLSSRPAMAKLLRHLCGSCSVAVANSMSVAADFSAVCENRVQVKTIYNAVDLERFSPSGPTVDLDELSGMRPSVPDTIKVGLIGTLARWKGHETFLRAVSLIPRELPIRGYLIGDAIYQTNGSQYSLSELRVLAQRLGVADRVGFTAFVKDSAAAMRALDIVVHCSTKREPFGLVIAEAMACGRAVIASEGAGATELGDTRVSALTHRRGDAEELALRIAELVTNDKLRNTLAAAGRLTAIARFDRSRLALALIPIYASLIAGEAVATLTLSAASELGESTVDTCSWRTAQC